jgi:hypothetical protein
MSGCSDRSIPRVSSSASISTSFRHAVACVIPR